jgi:phosphohistidine phosphatase
MDLILWRHAEAEDGSPDSERALTAKGEKQAQRMAKWLRARLPGSALILASPARRTQQTVRALTDEFKTADAVGLAASAESVLAAAGWPARNGCVVVVGHQPTLGETAALALTGAKAAWSVKKGAIVWLESRADRGGAVLLRAALTADLI